MKNSIFAALLLVCFLAPESLAATRTAGQTSANPHMFEFSAANPPMGWVQFCEIHPEDCGPFAAGPARIQMTGKDWRQLVDINDYVNALIEPATDLELYGVDEWWTYPTDNRGDCEDYVLLKRKLLLKSGWPASALLITVVHDEQGEGHAVLTVTTSAGDLILDNQHTEIRLWRETPYRYLMRQSKHDPSHWVSLRDDRLEPRVPVAGFGDR